MPGEYSDAEVAAMNPQEVYAAAQRGFKRLPTDPADRPEDSGRQVIVPNPINPRPSGNVWASRKAGTDIFTCPSGQTCRLRAVKPEDLIMTGILDKVTRLEALAATLVASAEGMPPTPDKMPSREEFASLLETINAVVPLAVAEPEVLPVPQDPDAPREAALLYVDDIDLGDRMAIMEHALKGVRALDRFRNAG